MSEDQQPVAEFGPSGADSLAQFIAGESQVGLGDLRLPVGKMRFGRQRDRGDVGLTGLIGQIRRQRFGDEIGFDDDGFGHDPQTHHLVSLRHYQSKILLQILGGLVNRWSANCE